VALHAVNLGNLKVADTVAVLGCGPIGLKILQLARLSGAQDVFVTEVVEHRRRMAEKWGTSLAIDPSRQDAVRWAASRGKRDEERRTTGPGYPTDCEAVGGPRLGVALARGTCCETVTSS
jgi:threonine dehydrogenase-like Zn-dependent dehydrogenase